MNSCLEGYYSDGSATDCSPTDAGKFNGLSDDKSTQQTAASGKWALAGDIEERNCPAGSYCAAGVKTECQPGKYCPEGVGTESTPSGSGMVMNEAGLWY